MGEAILLKRRLILMGTGGFAVPSFEEVRSDPRTEIHAVVTKPVSNSPNKQDANPVLAWAERHSLPIITPSSINSEESLGWLQQESADLFFVCDYGQILSRAALATSRLGGINLHGSLLPRHRGAAPVQWSILRGDSVTGVSVIHMTPKLDGGPILSQSRTEVGAHQTADNLERVLSLSGVACTMEALDAIFKAPDSTKGTSTGFTQDASLVTPAPRLAKSDGQIDCRYDVTLIDRQIRGLQPWPGVFGTMIDDQRRSTRVIIGSAIPIRVPVESTSENEDSLGRFLWDERAVNAIGAQRWALMEVDGVRSSQLLLLECKNGFLRIDKIQPAGKRMLTSGEFLAGYRKNKILHIAMPTPTPYHPLLEKLV